MNITVDALPILGNTGMKTYLHGVINGLAKLDSFCNFNLSLRLGFSKCDKSSLPLFPRNVSYSITHIPNRILEHLWTSHNVSLPGSNAFFGHPDVYLSTFYFIPAIQCPKVSIFYDLTTMKFPEYSGEQNIVDLRIRNIIKRSQHIIAISEFAKKDLCDNYNIDPQNVSAVPLAADNCFRVIEDKEAVRHFLQKYNITTPFILYVGNLGPHKNVSRLVSSFAKLKTAKKIPHKLVLCGKRNWGQTTIETIRKCHIEESVMVLDYILNEDLPYLYNGADIFTYISLSEGFGLPLLEAMKCGIPVVASNVTSMPEVVGNAGLLVNPLDEDEIADTIYKFVQNEQLKQEYKAKGLERSRNFSWERTARETLRILKKCADRA